MWQVELPLYRDLLPSTSSADVLPAMLLPEHLAADYATQGASSGPHSMRIWRERYPEPRLPGAADLVNLPHAFPIQIAGMVICRQRPGTAKGHCFISLEDETGIANLFVPKKIFNAHRLVITAESFLLASGRIQIGEGDQATVYVTSIEPLPHRETSHATGSHDFH